MSKVLSCDWGTSFIRLRLADPSNFEIFASESSGKGILTSYNLWKESGNPDDATIRLSFYLKILNEHIGAIEKKLGESLDGIPVIISGMASSSIGMLSLAYQNIPFAVDGSNVQTAFLEPGESFKHAILLISGVKSEDDVMRGEETQLIGCAADKMEVGSSIYIFPGTHSKHIIVQGTQAVDFKTYMTGEFFELLSTKSILSASVENMDDLEGDNNRLSFQQGVKESFGSGLLHAAFGVRINSLFEKLSKKENYAYLSGLLIGKELNELTKIDSIRIYLCCGSKLRVYYETALDTLGFHDKMEVFEGSWVDQSVVRGQCKIYNNTLLR